ERNDFAKQTCKRGIVQQSTTIWRGACDKSWQRPVQQLLKESPQISVIHVSRCQCTPSAFKPPHGHTKIMRACRQACRINGSSRGTANDRKRIAFTCGYKLRNPH